ncbi:LytTR family DNA-binding domain-containing protein [Gracilibacillus sp. S3-1-1]|uniref:LytTR family DNA-binding domain-containing protein n=1 Tax=Gracilibacillus pellucidus TaxID=3095368 RepID=A0ACC6M159_9BACI|nr:LytTR family DNA-binding domain-containing protein [Gracilibacillus sp. S3-1-1]MDX8044677.1 LytTR family DNA-binding domain-containing protein [Gracilibacillus sp. S3-1-1]
MKVIIDIDPENDDECQVTIHAKEWTKEVEELVQLLKKRQPKRIVAVQEDRSIVLDPEEIDFFYARDRKVFASSHGNCMELKMKLYEIEEMLSNRGFIRFSKSVVGNINQIDHFELSFNGTLCVYFKSGSKEYVSRKYVNELKAQIMEGGEPHDR